MNSTFPDRILIVKLGSIGDAVNTLPLINALKAGRPHTELAWLIEPKSYPIVKHCRAVDRFILFYRGRGWRGVLDALKEIRTFQPRLVIDLQRILRSSFFTFFSGCPRRLGFDRSRCKEGSWVFTNCKIPPRDPKRHMVRQYLEFADYLGIEIKSVDFNLKISNKDRREALQLLPDWFQKTRLISLNIGAAKPANRWPLRHWRELIRLIHSQTSHSVILTGGPSDRKRGELLQNSAPVGRRIFNSAGRTSLGQLGGIFLQSAVVVSADTGPMHIASALGLSTLGLFGPADFHRTGPFRHLDLVIKSPLECSPCGRRRCQPNRCMEAITPALVFENITSRLKEETGTKEPSSWEENG